MRSKVGALVRHQMAVTCQRCRHFKRRSALEGVCWEDGHGYRMGPEQGCPQWTPKVIWIGVESDARKETAWTGTPSSSISALPRDSD